LHAPGPPPQEEGLYNVTAMRPDVCWNCSCFFVVVVVVSNKVVYVSDRVVDVSVKDVVVSDKVLVVLLKSFLLQRARSPWEKKRGYWNFNCI